MHLFDAKKNMLGGNGIVGSQIPVATGVAFKIKYNNEDGVVLCFFGDGAIHQGAFHESLNMAKLWNLPIIYICENNMYGMGTSVSRASSVCNLSIKSAAYGIPGKQVNGMDVLEVYEELKSSIKRAREDKTPSFLEMKTYRYKGHSKSDPEKYRTTEELNKFKQDDPIIALKALLVEANEFSEEEYQQMEDEIKLLCEESVKFAEESPEPPLEELYEDVFV
jgi:pyruvate dehydrogenase E1 component alpha subunit